MGSGNWRHCACSLCRRQRSRARRLRNRRLSRIGSVCVLMICGIILVYFALGGGQ
jgi:hypothetical protein